jgi:YD repeat-containing protein
MEIYCAGGADCMGCYNGACQDTLTSRGLSMEWLSRQYNALRPDDLIGNLSDLIVHSGRVSSPGDDQTWKLALIHLSNAEARFQASKSCPNLNGVVLEAPHGRYVGEQLVALHQNAMTGSMSRYFLAQGAYQGGWNFEPAGYLIRTWFTADYQANKSGSCWNCLTACEVVARYQYRSQKGTLEFRPEAGEQPCRFDLAEAPTPWSLRRCAEAAGSNSCNRPTRYRSVDGQVILDLSDDERPVLLYPDGTAETLARPPQTSLAEAVAKSGIDPYGWMAGADLPPNPQHAPAGWSPNYHIDSVWWTHAVRDRNGQQTIHEADPATGLVTAVVDPRGRRTGYERDAWGRITRITAPGAGGVPQSWQIHWSLHTFDIENEFPGFCRDPYGQPFSCPSLNVKTVDAITIPDGRQWRFGYGDFGNLVRVEEPDGAVVVYAYGGEDTPAHWPAQWRTEYEYYYPPSGRKPFTLSPSCPNGMEEVLKRRLTAKTVYPAGEGEPGQTTNYSHEVPVETRYSDLQVGRCSGLAWVRTTFPDESIERAAYCREGPGPQFGNLNGKLFARQKLDAGGRLLEQTAYGDWQTMSLFARWEELPQVDMGSGERLFHDFRVYRSVHERNGVAWSEDLDHEMQTPEDAPASPVSRTWGNIARRTIRDAAGSPLLSEETSYLHDPAYTARNLIRLPQQKRVRDGQGRVVSRADFEYDRLPLTPSGAPGLDSAVGSARGNLTRTSAFLDPAAGTGAVHKMTEYYDTGDVRALIDGRGGRATNDLSFGRCAEKPILTATTTNAMGHQTQTTLDCYTGQTFSVRDPNQNRTCKGYDALGREVETAVPGDSLGGRSVVFDDQNCVRGAAGPTGWVEYLDLGRPDRQRTVLYSKDGSPDGLYVKTFLDGLGRTVQTCSEADPDSSGGNREACTRIGYDHQGLEALSAGPFFVPTPADRVLTPPDSVPRSLKTHDALGRLVREEWVAGNGRPVQPPVRIAHSGSSLGFVTELTNSRGFKNRKVANLLGQTVKTEAEGESCPAGWCVTTMTYDALGRVREITDPAGNTIRYTYDGLGRRLSMDDPDMGRWSYDYDENGNLRTQTDAKGQRIEFTYDALNRVTRKILPPGDEAEREFTFYYDGAGPSAPRALAAPARTSRPAAGGRVAPTRQVQ